MGRKKDAIQRRMNLEIIDYVSKNPGCSAGMITSALCFDRGFKYAGLTSRRIGYAIPRNLKDKLEWSPEKGRRSYWIKGERPLNLNLDEMFYFRAVISTHSINGHAQEVLSDCGYTLELIRSIDAKLQEYGLIDGFGKPTKKGATYLLRLENVDGMDLVDEDLTALFDGQSSSEE